MKQSSLEVSSGKSQGKSTDATLQTVVALLSGLAFGIALHKAGVFEVQLIRDQMKFASFTMLKIFLTAAGVGTLLVTLMTTMSSASKDAEASSKAYLCPLGIPSAVIGAMMLGAGMTIAGSCPGTVFAQLGAGQMSALVTIVGMLLGALAYGLMHPYMTAFLSWGALKSKFSMHELLGMSRQSTGFLFSGIFLGMVAMLMYFVPDPEFGLWAPRWPAVIGGIMIGAVQVPLTLTLRKNAGSSSTYVTVLANTIPGLSSHPYFSNKASGMHNWWQFMYLSAAVVGSLLCTITAQEQAYTAPELSYTHALVGGFLCLFGSRLANGCTSGHGLSGTAHLAVRSFVAVAAMFAGGMATAALMF